MKTYTTIALALFGLTLCLPLSSAQLQPTANVVLQSTRTPPGVQRNVEGSAVQSIVFRVLNLGAYEIQLLVRYLDANMDPVLVLTDPVEEFGFAKFIVPPRSLDLSFDVRIVGHGSIFKNMYPNARAMIAVCTEFQVFGTPFTPRWQLKCT